MSKTSINLEELKTLLSSNKTREPREDELAFYEAGLKTHAEKHHLTFTELLTDLTYNFNNLVDTLTLDITDKYINHFYDFPKENFKANFQFHALASELFSKLVFENMEIKNLLYTNNNILETVKDNYDINSETGLKNFLLDSSFYLLVDREFNASIISTSKQNKTNPIYFNIGVPDILLEVSHLICKNGISVVNDALIFIKVKRNYLKMSECLSIYSSIIEQSNSARNYDYIELNKMQSFLMFLIQNGGVFFVLFHEYCHLILGKTKKKNILELLCDKIALMIILKMKEPVFYVGAFLGLYLIMLRNIVSTETEDTYPHSLKRYNQAVKLIDEIDDKDFQNKMSSYDKLLDIPHRYYEEEVYKMVTELFLSTRFEEYLLRAKDEYALPFTINNITELSNSVVTSSFSITPPSDEYLVTVRANKNGQTQYVHINTKTAIAIIASSLSTLGWSINPTQFGLMFLSMLIYLSDGVLKKIKNNDAALFGIINSREKMKVQIDEAQKEFYEIAKPVRSKDIEFNSSMESLINLGVIRKSDNMLEIKEIVLNIKI